MLFLRPKPHQMGHTHRLLRSLSLYGDFEEEKESKLSLTLLFRPGIPTGRVFICFSFHSKLPGRPIFPNGRFLSLQNECLKPVWSVLHSKKSFRIQYYLPRKPHPQKMQRIPLAVIFLMLRFPVNTWTYLSLRTFYKSQCSVIISN